MHGHVHPDFAPVASEFHRQLRNARVGGGAVAVYHRGECVVDVWGGDRDAAGTPWTRDTTALSFSTTKGVTSTALHVLADRGLVDWDAPVAEYWPEFAARGKGDITVRQVMSHQAGLHRIRSLVDHADRMLDWDEMVALLADAEPAYTPGGRSGYHGITYGWLVGEVVRRVSGTSLGEFVRTEIGDLLDCDGLFIGVPEAERHRAAQLTRPPKILAEDLAPGFGYRRKVAQESADALAPVGFFDVFWGPDILGAEIPGANGVFTARSLARMYGAIAHGGTLDGATLMSPDTVAEIGRIQHRQRDIVIGIPMLWRLGYHTIGSSRGVPLSAFGHWGYGGSGAWADPKRDLAMAMVVNRVAGTPFADTRMIRLAGATLDAADKRDDH
jgi:CubicO group peptidase (beta-lactamase class C family)